jgi:predicted nucleic acid-binding Zn ribbon protein
MGKYSAHCGVCGTLLAEDRWYWDGAPCQKCARRHQWPSRTHIFLIIILAFNIAVLIFQLLR